MRKVLFILMSIFLLNVSFGACDQTFNRELRYGWNYSFYDTYTNKNTYDKKLKRIDWTFEEKYDYNEGKNPNPSFDYSQNIVDKGYVIKAKSTEEVLRATSRYYVNYHPPKRSDNYDDIKITYDIYYTKYVNGERVYPVLNHKECVNYKITWCGDGVLDSAYEECDPGDPSHAGWGNKGCSVSCKAINGPECDATFNFTLRKGWIYNFNDTFKNTGTIPVKIKKVDWNFDEQYDLNGETPNVSYSWTDWIKNKNYVINVGEEGKIIESTYYPIKYNPPVRSYDNIKITYDVSYVGYKDNNETGYYIHTECANYEVSWCGDGIRDDYIDPANGNHVYEECDPNDTSRDGWGTNGCSATCEAINEDIIDLALTKEVVTQAPYNIGDTVEYKIQVVNQGQKDVTNVQIVDYVPENMEVVDGDGWSAMGTDRKVYYELGNIAVGQSKDITIRLKILDGATGTIINWAEISREEGGVDCDSVPDNNGSNDIYTTDYSSTNPNPAGCSANGTDEDDHDPASIFIGDGPACGTANGDTYPANQTDWSTGETFCANGTPNPDPVPFPNIGGTTNWTCELGGESVNCSASRTDTVDQPECGTANGDSYPSSQTDWPAGETFCANGTPNPDPVPFPGKGSSTSWTCELGGESVNCSASRANSGGGGWRYYCGDGDLNAGNVPYEECDEGYNGNGNENNKVSPDWDSIINYYRTNGLTDRADELENMKGSDVYCSTDCKLVPIETPCAVDGTCETGTCGALNNVPITPSQYGVFVNYINNLDSYRQYFCNPADSMLSFGMNQTLGASEFVWYCGTTRCQMPVVDTRGLIKVYGSYFNPWSCPECLGFDVETDNYIRRTFLSNYDTEYTRSIMQGDYLPIGFTLTNSNQYVWECNASTEGKYNFAQFSVKFSIDGNDKPFVVQSLKAFPDQSVMGQAYLPASNTLSLTPGEHLIRGYITERQKCVGIDTDGDGVNDTYNWQTESTNMQFAGQKFTVTKPYMIQAGSALTNTSNVDPMIDGKTLTQWGVPTPTSVSNYNKTDLENAISKFVEKYRQYATLPNNELFVDTTITWKKVPTQEVYYIDASTQGGFVKIWGSVTKPTTVIVENGDTIIEGDITGPLMLVVKGGDIKIVNQSMNKRTFMEGYYFTDGEFKVVGPAVTHDEILNKDPNSVIWYADGRLVVKGVLIGNKANEVYKRRRSVLKYWFNTDPNYGPAYAVRNGASLTIVPNSNLWANAPVGSKDLFQMLQIDKGN